MRRRGEDQELLHQTNRDHRLEAKPINCQRLETSEDGKEKLIINDDICPVDLKYLETVGASAAKIASA
jgi:hypothetical protein